MKTDDMDEMALFLIQTLEFQDYSSAMIRSGSILYLPDIICWWILTSKAFKDT